MAKSGAERQAAFRSRLTLRTQNLKRIHDTICAASRRGEPDAVLLAGETMAETVARLADDLEQRFGAVAPATTN